MQLHLNPIRLKLYLRANSQDLTRRKDHDRAHMIGIARSGLKDGLDTILDRISDGFFSLDTEWHFTRMNRRATALAPHKPDALIGKSIWKTFPQTVGSVVWTEFHRAVDDNIHVCFTYFCPCLGRSYEVNAYPSNEGLSVYFRDITDQYNAVETREGLERAVAFRCDVSNALCK